MKLIELYRIWMTTGHLPKLGLCNSIPIEYRKTFYLLAPLHDDKVGLLIDSGSQTYWGSGLPCDHKLEETGFTPLRQTIVLLICAIHNEL